MNHLPWHEACPLARPIVPYLLEDSTGYDFLEVVAGEQNLHLRLRQSPEDRDACLRLATEIQAICFFLPLRMLYGDDFDINVFVSESQSRKVVDSSPLESFLKRYNPKFTSYKDLVKVSATCQGLLIAATLVFVSNSMSDVIAPWLSRFETHNESLDLWTSELHIVCFSVDVLLETLLRELKNDDGFRRLLREQKFRPMCLPARLDGISRSLRAAGRCPSLVNRLKLSASGIYRLLSLPRGDTNISHNICTKQMCKEHDIDLSTYETQHAEDCEQACCKHVAIDQEYLQTMIDRDQVPLIRSEMDAWGKVTIKLVPASLSPVYSTISHVWSGGLGNVENNSLPECQLRRLHVCADDIPDEIPQRAEIESVLYGIRNLGRKVRDPCCLPVHTLFKRRFAEPVKHYWIDTLCVPVASTSHRRRAINAMARVYAASTKVIVLDPELQKIDSCGLSAYDLDLLITCSLWRSRSWCLQEGALALSLYICFADRSVMQPGAGCREGPLSLAGVIWSNDIEYIPTNFELRNNAASLTTFFIKYFNHIFCAGLEGAESRIDWQDPDADPGSNDIDDGCRFERAWGELETRRTTKHDDVAFILATLLNRSVREIQDLPDRISRMKAIIKSQRYLPFEILFAQPFPKSEEWVPSFPVYTGNSGLIPHSFNPSGLDLEVKPDGLVARCSGTYTLLAYDPTADLESGQIIPTQDGLTGEKRAVTFQTTIQCGSPVVLLLADLQSSERGSNRGLCFQEYRITNETLYMSRPKPVTWTAIPCNTSSAGGPEQPIAFHDVKKLTNKNGLLVNGFVVNMSESLPTCIFFRSKANFIDIEQWPDLHWERTTSFPFSRIGLNREQMLDYAPTIDFWFFTLPNAYLWTGMLVIGKVATLDVDLGDWMLLLVPWSLVIVVPGITTLEIYHIRHVTRFWAQSQWAATFWDKADMQVGLHSGRRPVIVLAFGAYALGTGFCAYLCFQRMPGLPDRVQIAQTMIAVPMAFSMGFKALATGLDALNWAIDVRVGRSRQDMEGSRRLLAIKILVQGIWYSLLLLVSSGLGYSLWSSIVEDDDDMVIAFTIAAMICSAVCLAMILGRWGTLLKRQATSIARHVKRYIWHSQDEPPDALNLIDLG